MSIRDQDDEPICNLELTEFDGEFYQSAPLDVIAPAQVGEHVWKAHFPAVEVHGAGHGETSVPFSFTVEPHPTRVTVWSVPSAVTTGETFAIKVGATCTEKCALTGGRFAIYDQDGAEASSGLVGSEVLPGTEALHYAEVEVQARGAVGDYRWEARFSPNDLAIAHAEGARAFGIRIVDTPEFLVKVTVIDTEKQEPIKGATVLMHPFRAFTDERGLAEIRVPRGEYKLLVSGFQYFPFRSIVEVSEDMATTAELKWEPHVEHYDQIY
ncbi:MAG: hypothetical protein WD273_14465 [Trueperaceae bacterium]